MAKRLLFWFMRGFAQALEWALAGALFGIGFMIGIWLITL